MDLRAADIGVEWAIDLVFDVHGPRLADLAHVGAPLLRIGIFFRHLRKRAVEYWNFVLQPIADVGIGLQREITRRLPIRRAQGNGLVAILVFDPHPAVKFFVRDIAAPEDDEPLFYLLFVGDETHPFTSCCVESVQNSGVND